MWRKRILMAFGDIRFWLMLFFLIRLIHITQPPLESSHNWRQTFTAMIARNFYEDDANILRPTIDYSGDRSGIIGAEFPVFSYSIAMITKVTGYQHWIGRLLNLIVSTLGIYCFYLLVMQFFNRRLAFFASILLLMSIWLMFSRKVMPDTYSVSLTLCSLFFGVNYLTRGKRFHFLLFLILGGVGVLAKLPAAMIFSVMFILVFSNSYLKSRRVYVMAGGLVMLTLAFAWYFVYVPQLVELYGNQLFFTRSFSQGLNDILSNMGETSKRFYFDAFQGYLGFAFFFAGLLLAFFRKQKKLINLFLVSMLFLVIYVLKTGFVFSTHSYYIIPFVPVMAIFGGYALSEIRLKWIGFALLTIASAESFANQQHDVRIKKNDLIKTCYESLADRMIPKNALVLTNGGKSTTQLYFLNRKGWTMENDEIDNPVVLTDLKKRGLNFIFLNTCRKNTPPLEYKLIHEEECIKIYKVD